MGRDRTKDAVCPLHPRPPWSGCTCMLVDPQGTLEHAKAREAAGLPVAEPIPPRVKRRK